MPSCGRGGIHCLLRHYVQRRGVHAADCRPEGLDPTIASLAMCLESVFSALAGWLILGETLSAAELCGCGLMFAAIVASQLPEKKRDRT